MHPIRALEFAQQANAVGLDTPQASALGLEVALLPGPAARSLAIQLLRRVSESPEPGPNGDLVLGLLLQDEDPDRSRRLLTRAEATWSIASPRPYWEAINRVPKSLGGAGFAGGIQPFWRDGDLDRVVEACQEIVTLDPENADAWHELVNTRFECGDLEGAEKSAREAVEARPESVAALADLGDLLTNGERFDEAAQILDQAMALDSSEPTLLQARARLALAQCAFSDLDEIATAYERQASHMTVSSLTDFGWTLACAPEEKLQARGIELLKRAGEGGRSTALADVRLAIVLENEDPDWARDLFDAAQEKRSWDGPFEDVVAAVRSQMSGPMPKRV